MTPKAIEEAALRFVRSRHPVVLLTLPACRPIAVNEAHQKAGAFSFEGSDALRLRTAPKFMQRLGAILSGAPQEVPTSIPRLLHCYCGEVKSILAFRKRDCIHEAHHETFLRYGGQLVSIPGWKFNFIAKESRNLRRVYRAVRVHSRYLIGNPPLLPDVDGILEVRMIPSESIKLVVGSGSSDATLRARIVLAGAGRRDRVLIESTERPIDRHHLPTYQILDHALEESYKNPALAKSHLEHAAELVSRGGDPRYPVQEVIDSMFEPSSVTRASDLRHEIQALRARLWDAPVVAGAMSAKLDLKLTSPQFREEMRALPLNLQLELADLIMPLTKLEAADLYFGPGREAVVA